MVSKRKHNVSERDEAVEPHTGAFEAKKKELNAKKWFGSVSEAEVEKALKADQDKAKKLADSGVSISEFEAKEKELNAKKWRGSASVEDVLGSIREAQEEQEVKETKAAQDIQRVFRGHKGRQEAQEVKETKAAQDIQRVFRGHKGRQEAKDAQEALKASLERSAEDFARSLEGARERELFLSASSQFYKELSEVLKVSSKNFKEQTQSLSDHGLQAEALNGRLESASLEGKFLRKKADAAHDYKQSKSEADDLHNPFTILSKAREIATTKKAGKEEFNQEIFRFAMKTMLLGPDFKEFKGHIHEKDKKALEASEKKLDTDLVALSDAMAKGIKEGNLHEPQKNGLIRKALIGVVKCVGAVVGAAVMAFGGLVSKNAYNRDGVNNTAAIGAVGGLVGGFVGYKLITSINLFINSESKSSTVEAQMDALVASVDKNFDKKMAEIYRGYAKEERTGGVTAEEKASAAKRIQDKKLFGSVRKGPGAEEIDLEAAAERAKVAKEAKASPVTTRFQDRFKRIKEQGKTFEGREKKRRDEKGDEGQGR